VQTGAAQMLGSEGDPRGDRGGILQWLALAPVAIGTKKSLVQRLQGSQGVTGSRGHKERSEIGYEGFPHLALTSLTDLTAPGDI
jgi:hypothetical protein